MSKKIFIKTFGCQMNEYDSNRIYDLISVIDFKKTDIKKEADCFVLNTCHIREKATEKVYDEIGRVKKYFRNLKKPLLIVSGCVAQAESEEMLKREPYIDIVIGPQSYHKISDLILNYQRTKKKFNETEFDVVRKFDELQKISNSQNKISSYLTIQEGCDKFCHFCVVPYTRGPEYSRPFDQIITEAYTLVKNGAKEITLLGQNVNAYNFFDKNNNYKLSSLIYELNNIKNLKRIRFTTSHPKDMTNDLINCFKDCKKLMPFLHLPVQSGSDKILKLMNRKHDLNYYLSIIKKLEKINKDIKFSSDFIVGYPGETESDFEDTITLIKKIGFVNSYSFIFSPRPGTPATNKKLNDLTESKKRLQKLQSILESFQLEKNKKYRGKYCEVLVENKLDMQEKYFGRTKCMSPVIFESDSCKPGELVNVKIASINQNNLFGIHQSNKEKAA
ncbi:MAG: tRNA (N6-isopentenyl adenosine(37)-C2)-methylthiotransferase MiaB [Pelagibacteraceae bacterium]|nr:tRNA (N6-isopentenyl adenosine(37)-C2)-methylthiotransferase MiaB [Pelagibacteraceae bacterium]PCH48717.1 MAG: tRNA (N6-isopentenyl adenosine(37)-C2)-methylthiotransferase MiaB [Pelagibacteraceae bacterium]